MNFPYFYASQNLDSIDIENIGNVCLEARNDLGLVWYLSIKTILGWSLIETWGPILYEEYMDYHYKYTCDYEEYNDSRLPRKIDKFINDPKKIITQVFFTDLDFVKEKISNLKCLQSKDEDSE